METFGYVYITTNKLNNKRYIGQHKSKDWDNKYFGSGKLLNFAIQKYGKENFICYPLAWAWNQKELDELEIDYIAHYKPEYNIATGGLGGSKKPSEETKRKISIANKGKKRDEETKQKISLLQKGKKLSEETKNKMRNKSLSYETKKKISEKRKGIKLSEYTKDKMRKPKTPEHCLAIKNSWIIRREKQLISKEIA